MARVIIHTETGPRKIDASDVDPEKGNVAICQCGLSAEYPFCDGSHRDTRDEQEETLYRYPDDGSERREVRIVETSSGRGDDEDRTDD